MTGSDREGGGLERELIHELRRLLLDRAARSKDDPRAIRDSVERSSSALRPSRIGDGAIEDGAE